MDKLILHIPHSSTFIPSYDKYILPISEIESEVLKLTDWYTEDIFSNDTDECIIANVSRLYCDMERFVDDEKEVMSKYWMWVTYTHTDWWKEMRAVSPIEREEIINSYYLPHHRKLELAVENQLQEEWKSLIIDCHSFSDIPFERELDKSKWRPDICLWTSSFHTSKELIEIVKEKFLAKWYSIKIDSPYSWTIVPLKFYNTNSLVQSLMIEINRKLYLKWETNNISHNYWKLKTHIQEIIWQIRDNESFFDT